MDSHATREQERLRNFVDHAAELTGGALASAAGVGVGYALGDPSGAAAGAAFGGASGTIARLMLQDMAHGALDFTYRMLGRREKVRVAAVVVYCFEKFQENLRAGQQPRQDGFFDDAPNERSADKELFEGILLAAQREHQEKKLRYFGNLVANIAFEPSVDRAHANHLLKVAEALSYRQLCMISLFEKKNSLAIKLRQEPYKPDDTVSRIDLASVLREVYDLYLMGLVGGLRPWRSIFPDLVPAHVEVFGIGFHLYQLMGLENMPDDELAPIFELLQ